MIYFTKCILCVFNEGLRSDSQCFLMGCLLQNVFAKIYETETWLGWYTLALSSIIKFSRFFILFVPTTLLHLMPYSFHIFRFNGPMSFTFTCSLKSNVLNYTLIISTMFMESATSYATIEFLLTLLPFHFLLFVLEIDIIYTFFNCHFICHNYTLSVLLIHFSNFIF